MVFNFSNDLRWEDQSWLAMVGDGIEELGFACLELRWVGN